MKSVPGVHLLLGALGLLAIGGRLRAGSRAHLAALASSITPETPLYHGTRHDFETFVVGHPERKDAGWLGRGVYLTDSPDVAEAYARNKRGPVSPRVMEVRAHLQNPYVVDDQKDPDLKRKIAEKGERATLAMTDELRRLGHDGVILPLSEGGRSREIVVLDPARVQWVRTRVLPPIRRKKVGSLARATPILFHVSPASNRTSIERQGLRAPAYLVADASGASAIAGAHREDGEVVDTWRVDASGLDVDRDPEQPGHWLVCREPVPASRVTRVLPVPTDVPAFRAWFGQSRAVDDANKPLIVYHGTNAAFSAFRRAKKGWYGSGIYFTPDPGVAREYAVDKWEEGSGESRVVACYLRMEHPFRYYHPGNWDTTDLVRHVLSPEAASAVLARMQRDDTGLLGDAVRKTLEARGYDGLIVENPDGTEYVVFQPSQVKSVENIGTWDPRKRSMHLNRTRS